MGRVNGEVHALLVAKDGQGRQYRIDASAGAPTGMEVRRFAVGSQSEGCVFDDEAQALYIGEELKGVWRYGADPASGDSRTLLHGIDQSGRLIADVEGITLIRSQGRTYRSEEHTSELQSLMRISYAVFCLKKKKT